MVKVFMPARIEKYATKEIDGSDWRNQGIEDVEELKSNLKAGVNGVVRGQSIEWQMFWGRAARQVGETGVYRIGQLQSRLANEPGGGVDKGVLAIVLGQKNGDSHDYCVVLRANNGKNLSYRPIRDTEGGVCVFKSFSEAQRETDRCVALMITDYCLEHQKEMIHERLHEQEELKEKTSESVFSYGD
jgi:hypothetical protein